MEGGVLLRTNCGIYSGNGNGRAERIYEMKFSNNDHLRYYYDNNTRSRSRYSMAGVRCRVGNCKKDDGVVVIDPKDKRNKKKKMMKKRLKLVKGLSNDLALLLSSMGTDGLLLDPLHHQGLQEASEALLSQLKKLQGMTKEVKAKCKAASKCTSTASSSSLSSESSDGECETEFLDMSCLKRETFALPPSSMTINEDDLQPRQLAPAIQHEEAPTLARPLKSSAAAVEEYNLQKSEQNGNNILLSLFKKDEEVDMEKMKKIEVCMGGKCKNSGARALLEEFQKVVGVTAPAVDVVGCKCMGKCKDGPNVRLVSSSLPNDGYVDDELPDHCQVAVTATNAAITVASSSPVVTRKRTTKPSYPLCIGVGLEDVRTIVSKLTGDGVPC